MKKVSVEVLEDASHPAGGYAVVLLHGVESIPDTATFRIKPVEARGTTDKAIDSWPQGDLRPLAVRAGERGIELLIGPDIVENSALLPGTLGVIEIKAAGLRGEFLWPSIRPTARPKRRNLSVVKSPLTPKPTTIAAGDGSRAIHTHDVAPFSAGRSSHSAFAAQAGGRVESDLAHEAMIGVTALDHEAPAAASIAEAIGGNVVQFNAARDVLAHDRKVADGDNDPRDGVNRLTARRAPWWPNITHRMTALIATAAVVLSGGYLAVGRTMVSGSQSLPVRATQPLIEAHNNAVPPVAPNDEASAGRVHSRPDPTRTASVPPETPVSDQLPRAPTENVHLAQPAIPDPIVEAPEAHKASQPVTLRMRGGGFQISGELKGFDGAKYVIETRAAGVLTMDAARFECEGEACARPVAAILPLSERPSPSKPDVFRIEGAPALASEFIPQLIRDYAASIGANASELPRERTQTSDTARRYRLADPRGVELATIEVVPSGSAAGLVALERGAVAMALVDRPLAGEPEQRQANGPRGRPVPKPQPAAPVTEVFVGLDGIAAVAAPATAPGSIPLDLLAKVVAGQITDWFQLGQPPGAIALYLPPDATGAMETFVRQVMRPRGLDVSRTARRMPTENDAADAAARDPRGLALVSFAAIGKARPISLETTCGLVVRPTTFAVKAGEYPLVRRLSLHLPREITHPSARGIIRIAQSGDAATAVAAARIIDPAIASLPIAEQSERMAWAANAPAAAFDAGELRQMLTDLDGATRLSVTLRFVPGTNEFDQAARRDIARLAVALKEPEFAGRRIILAGFTDAAGKLQANMAAATRRAGQVRSALVQAAGSGFDQRLLTSKGYGPLAPVACAGTPDGTRLNRRVEVWVGGREIRSPGR